MIGASPNLACEVIFFPNNLMIIHHRECLKGKGKKRKKEASDGIKIDLTHSTSLWRFFRSFKLAGSKECFFFDRSLIPSWLLLEAHRELRHITPDQTRPDQPSFLTSLFSICCCLCSKVWNNRKSSSLRYFFFSWKILIYSFCIFHSSFFNE